MTTATKTETRRPTIHLNGSSRRTLLDAYCAQYEAVSAAMKALEEHNVVHGRDYYHQGDFALAQAIEQHRERVLGLRKIRDELYFIIGSI